MTAPGDARDRGHDRDALLRELVASYAHGLRTYLSRLERDPEDVEEVLADVFFLAHAHLDTLATLHVRQVRTWLFRSAKLLNANRSRSKIRRRQHLDRLGRQAGFVPPPDDEFDAIDAALDGPEGAARIAATMASLRPEHRQALVLDALGRTGPEIAAQLGISAVAARKRLMHARVAFRAQWAELGEQDDRTAATEGTPPAGVLDTERSRP